MFSYKPDLLQVHRCRHLAVELGRSREAEVTRPGRGRAGVECGLVLSPVCSPRASDGRAHQAPIETLRGLGEGRSCPRPEPRAVKSTASGLGLPEFRCGPCRFLAAWPRTRPFHVPGRVQRVTLGRGSVAPCRREGCGSVGRSRAVASKHDPGPPACSLPPWDFPHVPTGGLSPERRKTDLPSVRALMSLGSTPLLLTQKLCLRATHFSCPPPDLGRRGRVPSERVP